MYTLSIHKDNNMADIFDNKILCSKCNVVMKPVDIEKNGFVLRAVQCDRCGSRIIHPKDEAEFEQFSLLKNKIFKVKMRVVGNSYAVSIPKEIVEFIKDQERIMDNFVRVAFNDARKLSLMFGENLEEEND